MSDPRPPSPRVLTALRPWVAGSGLALLLAATAGAAAPAREVFELSGKYLGENQRVYLPTLWKYHPGDEEAFAAHTFDDSYWDDVDTRFADGQTPPDWDGCGWFRLRFRVDPDLEGEALAFGLTQYGAAEVYLDGEKLLDLGTVGTVRAETRPRIQRRPHIFAFDEREEHVLAIRFANHDAAAFDALGRLGGFKAWISDANGRVAELADFLRDHNLAKAFFTAVYASFALVHLLFFAFYPRASENLYFALLMGTAAAVVYHFFDSFSSTEPAFFLHYERGMNFGSILLSAFSLRFVYSIFYERLPRSFYVALVAVGILAAAGWIAPLAASPWILALVLVVSVEMTRTVAVALRRRKPGARLLGAGILTLAAGTTIELLAVLDVLPSTVWTMFVVPFGSMLCLVLSMSVHLSRRFAETNHELLAQLRFVEELSRQQLEQERRAREEEVDRARLEAAYARKVEELEEARQLQLSLLPARLPELPQLEIAAEMRTATEVGGDYYDFDVADDGTLTVAIGDATGHGMRAGTMVTATKSLFTALSDDATSDLRATLGRFTRTFKRMNLRQLSMSLTLARYRDGRLRLAAAGMPPAFLYRAASASVETLALEGAPLGSLVGFPYSERELKLEPGDTLLLMSDGFPERLNGDHEMLGYDKALEAFSRAAPRANPRAVIEQLLADGEAWADGRPAQDDTTFVVLRVCP